MNHNNRNKTTEARKVENYGVARVVEKPNEVDTVDNVVDTPIKSGSFSSETSEEKPVGPLKNIAPQREVKGNPSFKVDRPLDNEEFLRSLCRWVEARVKCTEEFQVKETKQHSDPRYRRSMFQQYAMTIRRLPVSTAGLGLQYAMGDFQEARSQLTPAGE